MGPTEKAKNLRERRWAIVAEDAKGRLYLNVRDGERHAWSEKSYHGLRFRQEEAVLIAASLTRVFKHLPVGAKCAVAIDTWATA